MACSYSTGVLRSSETAPPPLGQPSEPRHGSTVGSYGVAVSYKRGTPVTCCATCVCVCVYVCSCVCMCVCGVCVVCGVWCVVCGVWCVVCVCVHVLCCDVAGAAAPAATEEAVEAEAGTRP